MLAVSNENSKIAKMLIEDGADVNAKDKFGNTALLLAAHLGSLDLLTGLLSAGADLDEKDDDGETALMSAVAAGDAGCVQALLKAGADMNARNDEGKTALALAREYNHEEIVKLLEARGAPK